MLNIKGFVTIGHYINNSPDQVALLGELSTWSKTYSKDFTEYNANTNDEYRLSVFKSLDTTTGNVDVVPNDQVTQILEVVAKCEEYAGTHIRPYDSADYLNYLVAEFVGRISGLTIGTFVDNGNVEMPEWLSWTSDEYGDNEIRIWLADHAFRAQYDEYEITVTAPVINLDDLFAAYGSAVTTIGDTTINTLLDRIETVKGDDPETYLRVLEFDYFNSQNLTQFTSTNWGLLIYGKAGDNIDIIKDTLVEYILTHSTHTNAEWTVVLPGIFKRTEFTILPRWDKVSIPNQTNASTLYSSMLSPEEVKTFCKNSIAFYDNTWIENNVIVMPYDYKAIMLNIVTGQENVTNSLDLTAIFPDYIPVSTATVDFNRMTIHTREWALNIERLLIAAETADEYTLLPEPLRKITRNGTLYITAIYDNINYLVAAKNNTIYGF